MRASHEEQLKLLDLAQIDTTVQQLQHQRRSLAEHVTLQEAQQRRDEVSQRLVAVQTQVSDLEADQKKAESDLQPVRDRRERNQKKLDAGQVPDPKAATAMMEEVAHLERRIGELEDAELEVMEQLEQAQAEREKIAVAHREVDEQVAHALAARDEKAGAIDEQLASAASEREQVTEGIDEALLKAYDKLAGRLGTGAAELAQGRCGGCRIEANQADLQAYLAADADEVVRCEECGRILVRTGA